MEQVDISKDLNGSLLSLVSNDNGYSVVKCPSLTNLAQRLVLNHITTFLGKSFSSLQDAIPIITGEQFPLIREKHNRLLPKKLFEEFHSYLHIYFDCIESTPNFITDEEGLGYGNVYWRMVRANKAEDVGPIHADSWFWDLGHGSIPSEYERIKIWLPLVQDNTEPSLIILPGSHQKEYTYSYFEDKNGKKKPLFSASAIAHDLIPAPINVGECIVFNDRLLHGGRSTGVNRISLEWTLAVKGQRSD